MTRVALCYSILPLFIAILFGYLFWSTSSEGEKRVAKNAFQKITFIKHFKKKKIEQLKKSYEAGNICLQRMKELYESDRLDNTERQVIAELSIQLSKEVRETVLRIKDLHQDIGERWK